MSQEKLNHVIMGVLCDFMEYLITRKEQIVLSSHNNANSAIEAVQEFLLLKNIKNTEPLFQWEDRCEKIEKEDNTDNDISKIMKSLKQAMKK